MKQLNVDLSNMKVNIVLDDMDSVSITKEGVCICSNGMKCHIPSEVPNNLQINADEGISDAQITETSSTLQMTGTEATQAGFQYIQENEGITIKKYTGRETHVIVPTYIDGLPVKQISEPYNEYDESEEGIFKNNQVIESVVLPETLEVIEYNAFFCCHDLKHVNIPESVTNIGMWAFGDCDSLSEIVIPGGVTNIGDYAFYECTSLKNVVIPNSVTRIGEAAFCGCESLSKIVIPDTVTNIGDGAFCDVPHITYHGEATSPNLPNWGAKSMN